MQVTSIVFAAGKGSRMTGYGGNKTLLPLIPSVGPYEGEWPLILEVLANLPPGPKGIVVHHRAEDVRNAVRNPDVTFIDQPVTNGTGGALLAARSFLESVSTDGVLITMGDVPLIRATTYRKMVEQLSRCDYALLAFEPEDKAQYGVLDVEGDRVHRIIEWKYWRDFSPERRAALRYCNAGVYAGRRSVLLPYVDALAEKPHTVTKQRGGESVTFEEYFITDLVEMMYGDGRPVGMVTASEAEVTGVDTPEALQSVQACFSKFRNSGVA